jgi:(p)ppGpp synthase/HD superfamily hydrolase
MKLTSKDLERAIIYFTEKHTGQVRKGNKLPYILHPIRVMITLMEVKASKNIYLLSIASLAHDSYEDVDGVTLAEIAEEFGHHVAAIVQDLTSDKEEIKKKGKAPYLLEKMLEMSSYSLCIKLVDRYDNIKDMDSMNEKFRLDKIVETRHIIKGLKEGRDLTSTHKKIIKKIEKVMSKYEKKQNKIDIVV